MSIRTYNAPVSPTSVTVDLAQRAIHEMERPGAQFALVDRVTGQELQLSEQVHDLLRKLLIDLAQNRPVAIVPLDHELTPNQAADILNTSRGHVLRLIEKGELTARTVGTHRRVRLEDLLAYKAKSDALYEKSMDELVAIEQELGLD
jgi:excisionase family DNA binding protein